MNPLPMYCNALYPGLYIHLSHDVTYFKRKVALTNL